MDLEELGCKTVSNFQLPRNRVHCVLMRLICSHFFDQTKRRKSTTAKVQFEDKQFYLKCYILFEIIGICNYQVSCFMCLRFQVCNSDRALRCYWILMLFVFVHSATIDSVIATNELYVRITYVFTYNPSEPLHMSIFLRSSSGSFTSIENLLYIDQ